MLSKSTKTVTNPLKLSDFTYHLPPRLIADQPVAKRSESRLLSVDIKRREFAHSKFFNIVDLLDARDLLVFNDTKVIPARIFAQKESGGKVEILLERLLDETRALVQMRASKSPKPGTKLHLLRRPGEIPGTEPHIKVAGREGEFFVIDSLTEGGISTLIEAFGHMPLPPYIQRAGVDTDLERYQTVYSNTPGAVAAPTAGLHFDAELLEAIALKGIATSFLTLHVGAGTFQAVRVDSITEHKMHSERIEVNATVCEAVQACRAREGKVIAVGTTSVRSLETAAQSGELLPYSGETDIFIYPGFKFNVVDAMITNFHLPESSLLMLVSAFASRELILSAYQEAIDHQYRFFSYGDAMFLHG